MKTTTTPTPKITRCSTCGSAKIRRLRKTVARMHAGRSYVVPDLAF